MSVPNLFHAPVLKKEILALLLFEKAKTVFDGTVGLGGHAEAILSTFPNIEKYIACDLDSEHLEFARRKLGKWQHKTVFYHSNFSLIKKIVQENKIPHPLVILLDLGLCSSHIDRAEKGFSFDKNGPLSMSFDADNELDCAHILNTASEAELLQIFREYGEEPFAKKLARKIVEQRTEKYFETTADLRALIEEIVHPRERKKSLMRVFQALRIAVNDELHVLEQTLASAIEVMRRGDRMGVISYHSLEDRIVKHFFLLHSRPITRATEKSLHEPVAPADFLLLTKKQIAPSEAEIADNPRSRSAHLRIVEKI